MKQSLVVARNSSVFQIGDTGPPVPTHVTTIEGQIVHKDEALVTFPNTTACSNVTTITTETLQMNLFSNKAKCLFVFVAIKIQCLWCQSQLEINCRPKDVPNKLSNLTCSRVIVFQILISSRCCQVSMKSYNAHTKTLGQQHGNPKEITDFNLM